MGIPAAERESGDLDSFKDEKPTDGSPLPDFATKKTSYRALATRPNGRQEPRARRSLSPSMRGSHSFVALITLIWSQTVCSWSGTTPSCSPSRFLIINCENIPSWNPSFDQMFRTKLMKPGTCSCSLIPDLQLPLTLSLSLTLTSLGGNLKLTPTSLTLISLGGNSTLTPTTLTLTRRHLECLSSCAGRSLTS